MAKSIAERQKTSLALRALFDQGKTAKYAAFTVGCSRGTAQNYYTRFRNGWDGTVKPKDMAKPNKRPCPPPNCIPSVAHKLMAGRA